MHSEMVHCLPACKLLSQKGGRNRVSLFLELTERKPCICDLNHTSGTGVEKEDAGCALTVLDPHGVSRFPAGQTPSLCVVLRDCSEQSDKI